MNPSESIESEPCDAYRQSPVERLDSLKRGYCPASSSLTEKWIWRARTPEKGKVGQRAGDLL